MNRSTRWMCMALAVMLWMMQPGFAAADDLDFLKPMWLNALEDMQEQKRTEKNLVLAEPKVVSESEQIEVVRSSVYMQEEYETEAYVYVEVKNTSQETIRPSETTLIVRDANGKELAKREYASCVPQVILPGESACIEEWFYDFVSDLSRVSSISVRIENSDYSRKKIAAQLQAEAYVEGDYLMAQVTNTTDAVVYDIDVSAVVSGGDGKILDMCNEGTFGVGVAPGSTIVLRSYLKDHTLDIVGTDTQITARGFAYTD